MMVRLAPPEHDVATLVRKYATRGANDDCSPFNSGNLLAWSCHTRGPITSQTRMGVALEVLRALPEPYRSHVQPTVTESLDALEGSTTLVGAEELRTRLVGHMALNLGGVCAVARDKDEATTDVARLMAWLGRRPHCLVGRQWFKVGGCWSYAYLTLSTGRCVLGLFLQID